MKMGNFYIRLPSNLVGTDSALPKYILTRCFHIKELNLVLKTDIKSLSYNITDNYLNRFSIEDAYVNFLTENPRNRQDLRDK